MVIAHLIEEPRLHDRAPDLLKKLPSRFVKDVLEDALTKSAVSPGAKDRLGRIALLILDLRKQDPGYADLLNGILHAAMQRAMDKAKAMEEVVESDMTFRKIGQAIIAIHDAGLEKEALKLGDMLAQYSKFEHREVAHTLLTKPMKRFET
jgi:hypothetical protein